MDKDPQAWRLTAGTLVMLAGIALTIQIEAPGPALPRLLSGLALGVVGAWLMAQANRKEKK